MARTANATEKMKRDALVLAAARQGTPLLCAICGKPIMPGQKYALDHGHALGRGGPNTVGNLFPVHDEKQGEFNCHLRKTAHPRGPHTAIGGDTFEAAKTDRLHPKHAVHKPPPGTQRPPSAWGSKRFQNGNRGFPPRGLVLAMNARQAKGQKVFTGAYTINAPSTKGASKIDYVAETVLGAVWRGERRPSISDLLASGIPRPSLRNMHMAWSKYQGWGAFMTYQVIVDLRFTRYLCHAEDIATWAAAGPGTVRGLNRIAGRRTDYPLDQSQALQEMRTLYKTIREETGVEMDFSDVPNILCETDKYCRVMNNEGAPRALYHPVAAAAE